MAKSIKLTRKLIQVAAISAIGTVCISFGKTEYDRKYRYSLHSYAEFNDFLSRNNNNKLAIIIGGGIIGTTTAFELHKKGYKTAIIDANTDVARECSYATWGGMSTAYYIVNYSKLFRKHSASNSEYNSYNPIYIHWKKILFDPHFARWGLCFLSHRNWIINKYKSWNIFNEDMQMMNTRANKIKEMQQFASDAVQYQINFIQDNKYIPDLAQKCHLNENGVAVIVRNNESAQCKTWSETLFVDGIYSMNDAQNTVIYDCNTLTLEDIGSALGNKTLFTNLPETNTIKYIKYMRSSLADSPSLCNALKQYLMDNNHLTFYGNTRVLDFDVDSNTNKICKIYTNHGLINIPDSENIAIVLCAGSWTPLLCRKLNLFAPVYPLKGYDFIINYKTDTIDAKKYKENIPKHALIDNHVYYVNYGTINDIKNRIRIASVGAVDGWNTDCDQQIKNGLYVQSKQMLPDTMSVLDDCEEGEIDKECVVGLRPLTSDTSLIVGKVKEYNNLYMNVGPGYNGFKMAMGSAQLLADTVVNKDRPNFFAPHRHNVKKSTTFCKFTDLLSSHV